MPSIEAIACVLPEKKIKENFLYNNHDKSYVDKSNSLTGVNTRYWANEESSLSLCIDSAEILIKDYSFNINDDDFRSSIDFLVVVTQTPEVLMPAPAYIIHDALNLNENCGCLSLNAGCTAYVDGISLIYDLIENRGLKNVLFLVGDVLTKYLDLSDFGTASVFGDAGSATLITSRKKNNKYLHNYGIMPKTSETLQLKSIQGDIKLKMDGFKVFTFAINNVPKIIKKAEKLWELKYGLKPMVGFYALHQANNMILDHVRKKLKLNKKVIPSNISKFGNTSGVTIPLLLCSAKVNYESLNSLLFCGFGVGLSWSVLILESVDLKSNKIVYK